MSDEDVRAELARLRAIERTLTARVHHLERELQASHALHLATIESLPFDFWARDREGTCFSQNATTLANWGNLIDKRPEDMDLPDHVLAAWLDNNRRALSGEVVKGDQEYKLGGELRYIHNILAPIRMADAIVGTLGVNIDITERRRAELARIGAVQALHESEEKLRVAVDAAGIGLWSWNMQADAMSWEPPMCAIFGVATADAPRDQAGFLGLIHSNDRARAAEQFGCGTTFGRWEDEFRIVRPDGEVRWVLAKSTVFDTEDRRVVLGAVIDVTDRHLRDERLREAQKLDAVGQLTAGIAHNFNNMLMGVIPYLELAARSAPPTLVPLLKAAESSAQRAADLVRQLMLYAGRNRPKERQIESVSLLVERAVELCRATFDGSITLVARYAGDARALIDAAQIEQAFLNILLNARDALTAGETEAPRIEVIVDIVAAHAPELEGRGRGRDHVAVRISDNGIGMDAATAARIYEPFFTTKEVGKGTGLGLATAHAILGEHGGWIRCDSTPGRGTTFRTYLPREAAPVSRDDAPALPIAGGSETILVVDDEAPIREVVSQILRAAGYQTELAASGEAALELLEDPRRASAVSVVLLDVSMPGMPRRELRSRLRDLAPRARVVYFTGYAFEADTGDTVLMKPVRVDPLLAAIRDALDQPAA